MQVNQNQIQRPQLIESFFNEELTPDNEYVTYIDCSTNASAVVHKKSVTPDSHNIKKSLKNESKYRIAVSDKNLDIDIPVAKGLTWSHDSIDEAYWTFKKMFPDCVIVKISAIA